MPQANQSLRDEWGGYDGIGEDKALNFLKEKGYKLSKGWVWILPNPEHVPTKDEKGAIAFLVDEWDFGGWVRDEKELKAYSIEVSDIKTTDGGPW